MEPRRSTGADGYTYHPGDCSSAADFHSGPHFNSDSNARADEHASSAGTYEHASEHADHDPYGGEHADSYSGHGL